MLVLYRLYYLQVVVFLDLSQRNPSQNSVKLFTPLHYILYLSLHLTLTNQKSSVDLIYKMAEPVQQRSTL